MHAKMNKLGMHMWEINKRCFYKGKQGTNLMLHGGVLESVAAQANIVQDLQTSNIINKFLKGHIKVLQFSVCMVVILLHC